MAIGFLNTHMSLLYEFAGAFVAFGVLVGVCAVLIARFDRIPLEDALYFAFITAFTVGFGDLSPRSRGARVVTVLLAFAGVVLVGIVVAVTVHSLDLVLSARDAVQSLPEHLE